MWPAAGADSIGPILGHSRWATYFGLHAYSELENGFPVPPAFYPSDERHRGPVYAPSVIHLPPVQHKDPVPQRAASGSHFPYL